jgi:hypothetical protein
MAITVQSLDELTDEQVSQAYAIATQFAQEKHPNLDTKRGPVPDLVLGLDSILGAAQKENTDRVRQSQSVVLIEENPELADDDLVDNVASNYRVTRRAATPAAGEVVITMDQQLAVTIQTGAIFYVGDHEYTSDETYTARLSSGAVVADTDRLVQELSPGVYGFSINVTASVAGSASLLRKDDELTPDVEPLAFIRAYAASDFTGGLDAQTNQELVDLFQDGMSTKAYSNRSMIRNMVRGADPDVYPPVTDAFDDILNFSIIGMGDVEMVRDQHWLMPMSGGGRSDIYVRSQRLPGLIGLLKTATLVEKTIEGGIWQVSILRDDAPGFYEARTIRLAGLGPGGNTYAVTEDIRGLDTTDVDNDYIPDVLTILEGTYSRFQTAVIKFLDTDTEVSVLPLLSTQDYDVTMATMPLIREVQEFIGLRDVVNPCGDHLVKAPVPCFTSLSITLERKNSTEDVDTDAIVDACADYVNTTGFPGKLYSTAIASVIEALLPASVSAEVIAMLGRVRSPGGTETTLNSTEVLTVPDDPATFTTARTVCFIVDPNDIAISIIDIEVAEA